MTDRNRFVLVDPERRDGRVSDWIGFAFAGGCFALGFAVTIAVWWLA